MIARLSRPAEVLRLRLDGLRVEAGQRLEGLGHLLHAHPPIALASGPTRPALPRAANLRTKILDFGGFDRRGGIIMSLGNCHVR